MGGARVQAQELVGETAGQDVRVQVPAGALVALEKLANVWPGGWVQPVRTRVQTRSARLPALIRPVS